MTELTYKRLPAEDTTDVTGEANQSRRYHFYAQSQTSYADADAGPDPYSCDLSVSFKNLPDIFAD